MKLKNSPGFIYFVLGFMALMVLLLPGSAVAGGVWGADYDPDMSSKIVAVNIIFTIVVIAIIAKLNIKIVFKIILILLSLSLSYIHYVYF